MQNSEGMQECFLYDLAALLARNFKKVCHPLTRLYTHISYKCMYIVYVHA